MLPISKDPLELLCKAIPTISFKTVKKNLFIGYFLKIMRSFFSLTKKFSWLLII